MANKSFKTIDDYIKIFPANVQSILRKVRLTIKKAAPRAEEVISYGIPAFNLGGRCMVYFAGYKNHVGIYPMPAGDGAFQRQLSGYRSGKATARFPLDEPIPYGLVKKIVLLRVKESKKRK